MLLLLQPPDCGRPGDGQPAATAAAVAGVGCAGFAYIFFSLQNEKKSPIFRLVSRKANMSGAL
jgi:hypothetical protein